MRNINAEKVEEGLIAQNDRGPPSQHQIAFCDDTDE